MLTTKQAAQLVGISLPYMYDLIRQNKIKYTKVGATYIFNPQDVHTFKSQWRTSMTHNHSPSHYSPTECRSLLKAEGFYNNREKGKKRGWWLGEIYYGLSARDAFLQWTITKFADEDKSKHKPLYLEKRKYYRKKTNFKGKFIVGRDTSKNVTIVDLSRSGAKLKIKNPASDFFETHKIGILVFHLDDHNASVVKKEAKIKSFNGEEGICEFIQFSHYDRLTRYLAGTDFSTGRKASKVLTEFSTTQEEENFIDDISSLFEEFLNKELKS